MTTTATAAWPLDTLVDSLGRAGWGDLAGKPNKGVRAVLSALVRVLPHGSAEGFTTADQLARVIDYSERWVRRCLGILEDLGVITWRRGRVLGGVAGPSRIRVSKTALAALIKAARANDTHEERRTQRATALRGRVVATNRLNLFAPARLSQPEVASALSPLEEVTAQKAPAPPAPTPSQSTPHHPSQPSASPAAPTSCPPAMFAAMRQAISDARRRQ